MARKTNAAPQARSNAYVEADPAKKRPGKAAGTAKAVSKKAATPDIIPANLSALASFVTGNPRGSVSAGIVAGDDHSPPARAGQQKRNNRKGARNKAPSARSKISEVGDQVVGQLGGTSEAERLETPDNGRRNGRASRYYRAVADHTRLYAVAAHDHLKQLITILCLSLVIAVKFVGRVLARSISPVLSALVAVVIFSATLSSYNKWRYDDSPPISFSTFNIEQTEIAVGGSLSYTAIYTKRADCHPPEGNGSVSYKFRSIDGDSSRGQLVFDNIRRSTTTHWPPGKDIKGYATIEVPNDIPPGNYIVTRTSRYSCANASRELVSSSPTFVIRIKSAPKS
jgi:hypothetical protein